MLRGKPKILIVGSVPETRIPTSIILRRLGFKVRVTEDGFTALLEIRCSSPDILISDLDLPGMSGYELLSVVRRRFPRIRVIAIGDVLSSQAARNGVPADAFYTRSSGPNSLVELVQQLSKPGRRARSRDCAPIWISAEAQNLTMQGTFIVSCPECLRPSVLSSALVGSSHGETVCKHCSTVIAYSFIAAVPDADVPTTDMQKPHTVSRYCEGEYVH